MNNGIYWAHKGCKLVKDDFSIIGIQIARTEMHLNIFIRDMNKIYHFYNLRKVEIPIQPTDGNT
ncbi:9752_t:CDS:1, partial [Funneliformis geosporum]